MAVAAVVVVFLIRGVIDRFIAVESPFLLLSLAVLASAAFGGLGPAVLATLLAATIGDYFFLAPTGTLVPPSFSHSLTTALFLVQGFAISGIGAALFSAVRRARQDRETLRVSEGRLAEAQKMARIGNWDYEMAADEAHWSDELFRIFGFEPGEFAPDYKMFIRLVHPEDRKILRREIREAASGPGPSSVEYRIVRPDGEIRCVHTRYEPVVDGSGRMIRLAGTIQDVTERRRVEDALRESEERYRVVAETASDAIIVVDEAGCMSFVNEAAGRTFGYASEEMLGQPLTMLMPERLRELHQRALQSYVRTGERRLDWRSINLPGLHRSGREISLELSFGEFAREGRKFFTGFVRDITERQRAEEALREIEGRYRAAVEQAGDGVFLFDVETKRILETNPAFQRMLGYQPEELLELRAYDLVPGDPESVDFYVGRILEHGNILVGERRYHGKGGATVDVEVSGTLISFRGQRLVCAVARDITERKRSEQALREAREAERSRIAREMHDTVLQDIVYALQEIQIASQIYEGLPQPLLDSLDESAEVLRSSVESLREAIFELRLQELAGRSVRESLESLVDLNRRMARRAYEIELVVGEEFPARIPAIGAQGMLRVIQEALTNARRHASPSHVAVRLDADERHLWAEVEDDGRGFEPGSVYTGIGSDSMRQRAKDLDGELIVRSAPGQGTSVKLRVPRESSG